MCVRGPTTSFNHGPAIPANTCIIHAHTQTHTVVARSTTALLLISHTCTYAWMNALNHHPALTIDTCITNALTHAGMGTTSPPSILRLWHMRAVQ